MRRPIIAFTLIGLLLLFLVPLALYLQRSKVTPKTGFRGIRVLMHSGKVMTMDLEDYLVGVVAAEMPASFELEALKAQAVAARTYAVRKMVKPASNSDSSYDVDTTERTQAWLAEEDMRSKWGILRYYTYKRKIETAVQATKGSVLAFEGTYVQAFYFSSAGRLPTEKAEEVWGASLPYLTHVAPEKGELGKFVVRSSFTAKELDAKLGTVLAKKTKLSAADVGISMRTSSGRAKTVKIGSKELPATQVRAQLGLKSTDFTISLESNKIVITCYGNGHAVGMSQYGANSLAQTGKAFTEILAHYYPGTVLLNIN